MITYPKRLIEVDLPIRRISIHSRREKSIRHGHLSTLHIWWARRPLAACRAVLCASLWPDPADPACPTGFRKAVENWAITWADSSIGLCSAESFLDFSKVRANHAVAENPEVLRTLLLHFIADFANWDNSVQAEYLTAARRLTKAAFAGLAGHTEYPIVADPFAGGGAFPLEAARVGAEAFASDLNPVAVLLNKLMIEELPQHGSQLVSEVRKWGRWLIDKACGELQRYFEVEPKTGVPIAYLWARTAVCEGPGCGATIPLLRSLWLSKQDRNPVALRMVPNKQMRQVEFEIVEGVNPKSVGAGTMRRGSATCPVCGYTTPIKAIKEQFQQRKGGASDARLVSVVTQRVGGRYYRLPNATDFAAYEESRLGLERLRATASDVGVDLVPNEPLPYLRSIFNINLLGVHKWADLFAPRQMLTVLTLVNCVKSVRLQPDFPAGGLGRAVSLALSCAVDRHIDQQTTLVTWIPNIQAVSHTFVRQALGITWDFCEPNPIGDSGGNISGAVEWVAKVLEQEAKAASLPGHVHHGSATCHPLPDDTVDVLATDPPYYDAVPYADLSDFFYVWLKRMLGDDFPQLFEEDLTPKQGEIVQLAERNKQYAYKTKEYFEKAMTVALTEGRRIVTPGGLAVIVFAHKDTGAWETMLQSVIDAGWTVVASWPIDTERTVRLRAMNSAALGSSIHLVCRPREGINGLLKTNVGDWRDVLQELPRRIGEWMPRLASEGVVGADAIFACLGPALEIYSKYARVEKANGDVVGLGEYLESVWSTVSRVALNMIFEGADATGFSQDARLTAMWLWTISTRISNENLPESGSLDESTDDAEIEVSSAVVKVDGFELEFDAARKISQGLGVRLEDVKTLIEVRGERATLLGVAERAKYLFDIGIQQATVASDKRAQMALFDSASGETVVSSVDFGTTFTSSGSELDRLHQSMLLFAANRSEALKRLLVEDGIGRSVAFWRLAQALSALYPKGSSEKRWVDGVLARKKALGF